MSKRPLEGSSDGASKRRRVIRDERELRIPLEYGWRRQTKIRALSMCGVRGDVLYFAPCGKKMRTYPEVQRYLDKHRITDISRENFSFSTKINVGEFLDPQADGQVSCSFCYLWKQDPWKLNKVLQHWISLFHSLWYFINRKLQLRVFIVCTGIPRFVRRRDNCTHRGIQGSKVQEEEHGKWCLWSRSLTSQDKLERQGCGAEARYQRQWVYYMTLKPSMFLFVSVADGFSPSSISSEDV